MTKKEAQAYVENIANWKLIEETDHMRLYQLRYKELVFWRIDVRRINNLLEVLHKGQGAVEDFKLEQCYEDKNGMLYYNIRTTGIVEEVWRASK
mgnify:CR=1 FL=1